MTQSSKASRTTLCDEIRENLSAQFDGEDQFIQNAEIKRHLVHCEECAEYKADLKVLHTRLQIELTDNCDSDRIWNNVLSEIHTGEPVGDVDAETYVSSSTDCQPKPASRTRSQGFLAFALVASIAMGIVVGGAFLFSSQGEGLAMATETVRDYETFRVRGAQLDFESSSTDELAQWMSAKIDFKLPDQIKPPERYKVVGGRICSFLNRRLAFFQYEKDSRTLALYVMQAKGLFIPIGGEINPNTDGNGLTTVTWKRNDLAYVIVSDLPAEEVIEFANRT